MVGRGALAREPTETEKKSDGLSLDPGYARLDLSADGTIQRVEFRSALSGAGPVPAVRELGPETFEVARRERLFDPATYEAIFGDEAIYPGGETDDAELDASLDTELKRQVDAVFDDEFAAIEELEAMAQAEELEWMSAI